MIATVERKPNIVYAAKYIPLCPVHGVEMEDYSWRSQLIYFRCPCEGCKLTDRAPRVEFIPKFGADYSTE